MQIRGKAFVCSFHIVTTFVLCIIYIKCETYHYHNLYIFMLRSLI